jgi:hypothetical protein
MWIAFADVVPSLATELVAAPDGVTLNAPTAAVDGAMPTSADRASAAADATAISFLDI